MKEAVSDLNEELIGSTEQKKNQSIDALLKNFFGTSNPQEKLKKAYAGLANIEIKTGHKKLVCLAGVKERIFIPLFLTCTLN